MLSAQAAMKSALLIQIPEDVRQKYFDKYGIQLPKQLIIVFIMCYFGWAQQPYALACRQDWHLFLLILPP